MKLKWTRKTATYWVAGGGNIDATIKKWRDRKTGQWFYTTFVIVKIFSWSAGALTLADAKDAAQSLADALGKGE